MYSPTDELTGYPLMAAPQEGENVLVQRPLLRVHPVYQVLMQWRSKPGNDEVTQNAGALGQAIVQQLREVGCHQLSYCHTFFSSEWDGWRLFEVVDLDRYYRALQKLREAPVQLDKWLETRFTIGRAIFPNLYASISESPIQVDQVVQLTVHLNPEALSEPASNITFTVIDSDMAELVTDIEKDSQEGTWHATIDFDEEGKAQIGLKALQEGDVAVFIHMGDPPPNDDYTNNPKKGISFTVIAEGAK